MVSSEALPKRTAFCLSMIAFLCFMSLGLIVYTESQQTVTVYAREQTSEGVRFPNAACSGGPTIDGVVLDECFVESFTVGGTNKTVTVWYTNNVANATRTVDGTTYTLQHWVNNDTEPQQVAGWGREAWERYYQIFNHHPWDSGCGNNINVRLEDGIGWAGIAYWAGSGSCWIGIDSPTVRAGNAQNVVYHEFQHYLQYSFNSGCYKFLKDNYNDGKPEGDAEFVEGYADLAMNSINTAVDNQLFSNFVQAYDPHSSFYKKSYWDVFLVYLTEQLGSLWTAADPQFHMDAVRRHYEECDARDTLYVLDTLVPSLKAGMTEEKLFLNFFAANWAKNWASATTQPELVYFDDDAPGPSYGSITLWKNENLASGSKSWAGESNPDDWAARYYQVTPQTGCNFVTVRVDGQTGAKLGINLMAARTTAPTEVQRSSWIGESLSRTFSAFGTHDRLAAVVNAFASKYSYDVSFSCVTPVLQILEPRQTNFVLVGNNASPIAFLARFQVTSGGSAVLGLAASSFSAEAEGDPVTIVPGSLSQAGEEYWAVMLPPVKPPGTTFVDLKICVDGTVCDTETHALLYADPGNTDFALVFDASGSMSTEDVVGEGTRVANAKKAGTVLADLLRVGDRILVTDFSAFNSPAGCGLPSGSGNCTLNLITRLSRTSVTVPASAAIASTKTAINNISAREWTPIGAALRDAKDKLLAGPSSTNPKHIILLSDGEENVNPLYSTLRTELIDSGVVIDTIAFSSDAPAALLAQIAADTGGVMRYVPTTSGTVRQREPDAPTDVLAAQGVPPKVVENISTVMLPGQLELANTYDYFETRGQNAARIFHDNYTTVADGTWKEKVQYVDGFVTALRLVVSGKQADSDVTGGYAYFRKVEILPADAADPYRGWIPVSPPDASKPASWDVRNSIYDDVIIIPNPAVGTWKIRTKYYYSIGQSNGPDIEGIAGPAVPQAFESDFMMNGSVETDIRLVGRFLPPIVKNQGVPGDRVPIVATVFSRLGGIPNLLVVGAVERPGMTTPDYLLFLDDGLHSDGAAGDGIYGALYTLTDIGGSYNVRIVAGAKDAAGNWAFREWLGAFWLKPLYQVDRDKDGMPDPWEQGCLLNTQQNDSEGDADHDGLTNIREFHLGTLPCNPDTDRGGESDGSEVNNKRNPLWAPDDKVAVLGNIQVEGFNRFIRIRWANPSAFSNMVMFISTVPGQLGTRVDLGTSGQYDYPQVSNGQKYYIRLMGMSDTSEGDYSGESEVTPKDDPSPPFGSLVINNGARTTFDKKVVLSVSASDTPGSGAYQQSGAQLGGFAGETTDRVSGNIQMRISNEVTFPGASWESLALQKNWTLADGPGGPYRVYIQFRDGALNESSVFSDGIDYVGGIYLPIVVR